MSTATLEQEKIYEIAGFGDAELDAIVDASNDYWKAERKKAYAHFGEIPVPTNQDEEYRRTNPVSLGLGKFQRLENLARIDTEVSADLASTYDVVVQVSESGYSITDCSGAIDKGSIIVCDLDEAVDKHPESLDLCRGIELPRMENRKFLQMGDAFWNFGLFIKVPAKKVLEKGVLIEYRFAEADNVIIPKIMVHAESQSEASVVERYISSDEKIQVVSNRRFYIEAAADFKMIGSQEWGAKTIHIGEDWAVVKRDAKIDVFNLMLGSKVSKVMAACDTAGENAEAWMGGLYFADKKQHIDQGTLQIHSAPNTYSNMLYKGAVKNKAYSVYQGFIWAEKGANGVDAYQTNNNLLLDSGARADSIPGLIINTDDLACSHGATIGNLDPEQMYYLRSRGINKLEAQKMLVVAFFEEVVRRVPYPHIQDRLHQVIEEKLRI